MPECAALGGCAVPADRSWDDDPNLRKEGDAERDQHRSAGTKVEIISGISLTPRSVDWLWPDWLAQGKLHILAGSIGTGKTTIALALAAVVTTGGRWPDGSRTPLGDVLMWSGEDDPTDSLLPRFLASGGDPERIYFVGSMGEGGARRPFDPSRDVPALIEAARRLPFLRLLIFDPVVSAITGDSHKNAEVRRGLQPLVDFAAEAGCAVLGVTHFTKGTSGREPIERVTGSLAFAALPRIVLATAKPAEADGKRRLVRAKNNIGPDGGGYEYDLILEPLYGYGFEAQRIAWGSSLEGTARELLNDVEQPAEGAGGSKLPEAKTWLLDMLATGAMPVGNLKSAAGANGIAWHTIERAKKALGIVAAKGGMNSGWLWQLPEAETGQEGRRPPRLPEDRQPECVAAFEEIGGLQHPRWEEEL
jgi:putative DNA primase/helicase